MALYWWRQAWNDGYSYISIFLTRIISLTIFYRHNGCLRKFPQKKFPQKKAPKPPNFRYFWGFGGLGAFFWGRVLGTSPKFWGPPNIPQTHTKAKTWLRWDLPCYRCYLNTALRRKRLPRCSSCCLLGVWGFGGFGEFFLDEFPEAPNEFFGLAVSRVEPTFVHVCTEHIQEYLILGDWVNIHMT